MPVFQPSQTLAQCDECRTFFDPVKGGVCPSCRRLLCADHYYGSLLYRLGGRIGMTPKCPACRKRQ